MTRYARPQAGKKEAEDGSAWSSLKQSIPAAKQDGVVKKLKKKKKLKQQVVKDAIAAEALSTAAAGSSAPSFNMKSGNSDKSGEFRKKQGGQPDSEFRRKQGKGSMKFSKMDPEARRASRAEVHKRRRGKDNPCFVCRSTNHKASKCPQGSEKGLGMCFKCGSTEHTSAACRRHDINGFPHAKCFVCNETGHLSRSCPDNPRGLYPNGGCCKECGDVEHFAKDCPTKQKRRTNNTIKLRTMGDGGSLDDDGMLDFGEFLKKKPETKPDKPKPKVVNF
eukprot:sb/3467998/